MISSKTPKAEFINRYDTMILAPEMRALYDQSGFYNVGAWTEETRRMSVACQQMVDLHIATIPKDLKPLNILDVGCGLGGVTQLLAEAFPEAKVGGVNISARQIEEAQRRFSGIDFQVADATDLPFANATFDLIISVEAAFHFDSRIDFLEEAFRILRPGGHLIYTDLMVNDARWIGPWSVPEANQLNSIFEYENMLQGTDFDLGFCEDITAKTWRGFSHFLRTQAKQIELADGLDSSIIAYLLNHLKKPTG